MQTIKHFQFQKIWYREDKDIHVGNQWNVEENFLKEEQGWRIIIAAPFGIGKTSLTKHIAEYYASKHLDMPTGVHNYIPVFVQLKDKLNKQTQFKDSRKSNGTSN